MVQLTPEIKAKMRKMALMHFALALISAAALAILFSTGRSQGQFLFQAILFLNLLAIGLLAIYTRKKTFP